MSIEAMKQALEALERYCTPYADGTHPADEAIVSLRQAIEQAEKQEPVAFFDPQGKWLYWAKPTRITAPVTVDVQPLPLYTTPQPQQAEKQEPVSWVDLLKEASQIVRDKVVWKRFIDGTPLANDIACWMADFAIQHAQQPQREWVGLTDEERNTITRHHAYVDNIIKATEAKLKERNHG